MRVILSERDFSACGSAFHGVGGPSGKPAGRLSFVEKADGGGKSSQTCLCPAGFGGKKRLVVGVDTQVGTARCLEGICFLFSPCSLTHSREQVLVKSLLANGHTNSII